jgi:hypothetical protein
VIPTNKKFPPPLRRSASTRRATSPQNPAAPQRLTAGRTGGHTPLEQQTRIFAENLRWIEAGCRLRADLADLEGVRRLLFREYGRWVRHWPSAAEGDMEALHEVRITLRRLRTVLRASRKRLEPTSAGKLSRHLRQLRRDLGPARDLDVGEEFLRESGVTKGKFGRYPGVLHRRRQAMHRVVRRLLDPGAFRTLEALFDLLLRVELPQLRDKTASVPVAAAVRDRIIDNEPHPARRITLPDGDHPDFAKRGRLVGPAPRETRMRVTFARAGSRKNSTPDDVEPEPAEVAVAECMDAVIVGYDLKAFERLGPRYGDHGKPWRFVSSSAGAI